MQKIELTYLQMTLIGMGVGLVLGLIPLVLGFIKGKKNLAIWGLIASIAAGAAWSLFSLVVVIVFIWLILRKPAQIAEVADENPVDENPVDDSSQGSADS